LINAKAIDFESHMYAYGKVGEEKIEE